MHSIIGKCNIISTPGATNTCGAVNTTKKDRKEEKPLMGKALKDLKQQLSVIFLEELFSPKINFIRHNN